MTRKEGFAVLGLNDGADLEEIKRAYRKLAFLLHPDLHPDEANAAKRFQRVNEAYVLLSRPEHSEKKHPFQSASRSSAEENSAKMREEAKKAYDRARRSQESGASGAQPGRQPDNDEREDVLKDILNDPFARRVFEDIYSHIQEEKRRNEKNASTRKSEGQASADHTMKTQSARPGSTAVPEFGAEVESHSAFSIRHGAENGVVSKLKTWMRRQIDDEQVLRLPGESLLPGARVRLQIQHGLNSEAQVIELTLPPEFVPGKTMRLKGMGKRVGKWRGDLYVRIESA